MNLPAPLTVVIADDEPLVRRGLRRQLEGRRDFSLVGECRNGLEALKLLRRERPDLVLLDIQMPGLTGFAVVEALEEADRPAIIFVTAYDSYAIRAFDLHAVDYLLKPFDDERLERALARARQRLANGRESAGLPALAALVTLANSREPHLARLLVRSLGRTEVVRVEDVDWFEAADNYVRLHLGARRPVVRETLAALEKRLDPAMFARSHRSAVVNLARVRELRVRPSGDAAVILADGMALPVSRTQRAEFARRLGGRIR